MQTSTLFRTGSLTMAMTSAAIMQLVSQGRINLDKPVSRYLPDWPLENVQSPITIRHLLIHHSGLPLSYFKGMWTEQPDHYNEVIKYIARTPVSFPPGKIFSFSNLGYVVLGRVIEQVSGQSYESYVRTHLLQPMSMQNTTFNRHGLASGQLARSYRKGKPLAELDTRDIPALGLVSSTDEMANFVQTLLNRGQFNQKSVLKLAAVESMLRSHNRDARLDLDKQVGFGWRLSGIKLNGVNRIAWRFGATPAHRTRIVMLPEYGLAVIAMSNSSQSFELLEHASKKTLEYILKMRHGIEPAELETGIEPMEGQENVPFASAYSTYTGLVTVSGDSERQYAEIMGWRFRLLKKENGWFGLSYDLLGLIPINLEWIAKTWVRPAVIEGETVLIARYEGENYLFGTRLEKVSVPPAWHARFGEYEIRNPDTVLKQLEVKRGRLTQKNGHLVFEYRLPVWFPLYLYIPLQVVSDSQARIPGLGSGFNAYINAQDAEGIKLQYAGYILEQLN